MNAGAMNPAAKTLAVRNLSKSYGGVDAVSGVSFTVPAGQTLALLGPSGCGKSTLLKMIAGLEPPTTGSTTFAGQDVTRLSPQKRHFGMVFQDYALFPHLNVAQNVAYGLVEQKKPRAEREKRVAELLARVGLEGFATRRVATLSGGEQQRVALARALAPEPQLLLLDEPLSSLDLALRENLKHELKRLLDTLNISAIYVTHDQSEAFFLADSIALLRRGKVVQQSDVAALYANPVNRWAAAFLGHKNIFPSQALGSWGAEGAPYTLLRGDLLRLETLEASPPPAADTATALTATVETVAHHGATTDVGFKLTASGLHIDWQGAARELPASLKVGTEVLLLPLAGAVVGLQP